MKKACDTHVRDAVPASLTERIYDDSAYFTMFLWAASNEGRLGSL